MKVLFSCSEAKDTSSISAPLNIDSLSFSDGYHKRMEILSKYQSIINEYDDQELKKIFGVSKESLMQEYKQNTNIFKNGTMKAVQRYTGVGYKYLDYMSLDDKAQDFIDNNVVIFSNLFGTILAKDEIPFYKLKQDIKLDGVNIGSFYQKNFQNYLDDYFQDDLIVDLRANSYEPFYNINEKYHIKVRFLKDGKTVSHYSKAYRGIFLRAMSQKEKLKDIHHLLHMPIDNMRCVDTSNVDTQTTITYEYFE